MFVHMIYIYLVSSHIGSDSWYQTLETLLRVAGGFSSCSFLVFLRLRQQQMDRTITSRITAAATGKPEHCAFIIRAVNEPSRSFTVTGTGKAPCRGRLLATNTFTIKNLFYFAKIH